MKKPTYDQLACFLVLVALLASLVAYAAGKASIPAQDSTEKEISVWRTRTLTDTVVEYIEVPVEVRTPVRIEVPVIVEKPVKEYIEVPCGVSSRTERYAGIEISAWEMELMARLAWREARGEKILGMRLVLEVVLNRVLSPHFPNTVYGVLYDGAQFKPYDGALELEDITPTEAQYEAVAQVLSQTPMTDEDVVFFAQSPIYGDIWMHVGGHYFTYYPEEW